MGEAKLHGAPSRRAYRWRRGLGDEAEDLRAWSSIRRCSRGSGDGPDRCQAVTSSAKTLDAACRACRCRTAPILCAGRQAGVDQASTLCPSPIGSSAPTRSLRRLKTYLGRVIRDIGRRIDGDPELEEIFARPLSLSRRVLAQDQVSADPRSIPCTRRKWSASARARRIGRTNSG